MPTTNEIDITQSLISKLKAEKDIANETQERKHIDWDDNYDLYRNKIKTNRLTQRQAVGIPLMKETIKTLLSKIDDAPNVDWKELGSDEDKEILFQEMWDANFRENKLELMDIVDKKNVLLYGIGTRKLSISDSGVDIDALDPYDVVFDPLMEVGEVETARFVIHQNIFRSVREILANDKYTKEGKDKLKMWVGTAPTIVQSQENKEEHRKKMQRLQTMGLTDSDFKLFGGGDTVVNLTEHFTTMWDEKKEKWERRVVVYAENEVILLDETLESLLGVDFWPFAVWTEDPEGTDIYSDSVADTVRVPNKVINVWFSQLIENRTLKNFQMHWFLPKNGYTPQTYTAGPGVMLPSPPGDNINDVIKPVEISGLDDTLEAINALTQIVERSTGATAIEKGGSEGGQQTLGEVQLLVGKSMERAIGMAKFYRMAWYETAWKWEKLMFANAPKVVSLYKVGASGKMYTKKVYQSDWKSAQGYEPLISSTSEQEQESIKTIQKFMFLLQQFPDNAALRDIATKRMLESVDLTPEELNAVEEANAQPVQGQAPQDQQQAAQQPQQGQPDTSGLMTEIQNNLASLQA